MKKIGKLFCVLMVALMVFTPFTGVYAKKTTKTTTTTTSAVAKSDAVNVYVFYSPTCPHCSDLHAFLKELSEDKEYKDLFNVVDYDVSSSKTNADLWEKVGNYFEVKVEGVPFYVIGNQYYEGYPDESKNPDLVIQTENTIKAAIKNAHNDANYKDIVDGIGKGEITGTVKDSETEKKGNSIVGMVILAVTVVIIIILIVCSSKNKYYDDDDDDDDDDQEESEDDMKEISELTKEQSETSKSNATKKTNTKKNNSNKSTTTKSTKTTNKKKV